MDYFQKANEFYNSRSYKQAISLYKKAIENKENEACSYYNSAVCFIKLKEYEKAINHLRSAIILKEDSKYYFNLAYCYAMSGDNNKALLYFNTSWSLDHEDEDCKKAIDLILKNHIK
ncbi:tetratricopeptide repeat protein [Clostridium amazonitimonense]|uniref:tetratricopeptide repeat protein n=1 Tax=Clostridium amazonitimonense TaxID=1499689 RepID=UPI000509BAC6|nr:CDC27 family protein [Clostridium amazonitimonense]